MRVIELRRVTPLLVLVLGAGCLRGPEPSSGDAAAGSRPRVALIALGSAFDAPGTREQTVALLHDQSGRPVQAFASEPVADTVLEPIAKRSLRKSAGRYDWREPRCRKKARPVVAAITAHAEALYRIRLDARVTTRLATEDDRRQLGGNDGMGRVLSAIGLDRTDTVFETSFEGSIERTTFPGSASTERQRVRSTDRRLGSAAAPPALDVRAAISSALAGLPVASAARWDALARGLASSGCPFLAYAVSDAFVEDPGTKRKLEAAALGAMQRVTTSARRDEPAAAPPSDPDAEASTQPEPRSETAGAPEPSYSCPTLCSLHMIELCNNDRTLWSQHGTRWANTRCGTRRAETFLEECYRMLWLSGTYERACVRPCEETAEGRTQLFGLLRRAGCLRAGA